MDAADPVLAFAGFPAILEDIFMAQDWPQLDRCRLVCRRWRDFIDQCILGRPRLREELESRDYGHMWLEDRPYFKANRTFGE